MRFTVPAANFTAAFPKAGCLAIKKTFNHNNINCTRHTIVQASDLKESLENLNIRATTHTVVSTNAVNCHPSARFKLVEKAMMHFAQNLHEDDLDKLDDCLDPIWNEQHSPNLPGQTL